ncbi:MAG: hypothetical protein H6624_17985 [Bdellovibrionaceae bacterium]|nr:hypothetical protein [Bdellovibrionales bacterium]MCB9086236.1 hypothetical protein [Pseudobdellovibrionaceae bacterium]
MVVNSINFLILLLFFYGRTLAHKDKVKHGKVMIAVILGDFLLLLYLTIFREALDSVDRRMPPLLIVHIVLALITVVAYAMAISNGIKLLKGQEEVRSKMKLIDRIAVPGRTLVFVTSLMLFLSK